jgi:predicted pyridoxine 5'-phosphate oxidase superfamily flavin-nucleotide-binding protein
LLGIELETRRRNRLATHVTKMSDKKIQLEIDQSFGNCPQYIQRRDLSQIPPTSPPKVKVEDFFELDEQALSLIDKSDTFFVASAFSGGRDDQNGDTIKDSGINTTQGADVSHRGGNPDSLG